MFSVKSKRISFMLYVNTLLLVLLINNLYSCRLNPFTSSNESSPIPTSPNATLVESSDSLLKQDDVDENGSKKSIKELPCSEQGDFCMTDKCLRTYKCPPTTIPKDKVVVGLLTKNKSIDLVVAIDQAGNFTSIDNSVFSGLSEVYIGKEQILGKIKSSVSFDGVESDRCYFGFALTPSISSDLVFISSTNIKDSKIKLEVNSPTKEELALFSKEHYVCEKLEDIKRKCEPENEAGRGFDILEAVSDINQNGLKEYWYSYTEGYRYWFKAEEFDQKNNKWNIIASF
jgi:hypothetical protein